MTEESNQSDREMVMLTDITRGLYHAASTTHAMVANHYVGLLHQFFDKTTDGTLVPKVVVVQMPDETVVDLPLISLVEPKGLMLDKVNFDFAVVADPCDVKAATDHLDNLNLTRSSFKAEMTVKGEPEGHDYTRRRGVIDVNMKFRATEPPEGLMRLFDKFASIVSPMKPGKHTHYMHLLSPRFVFIADVLRANENLAKEMAAFNPKEYTVEQIESRGNEMANREKELLDLSIKIDVHKESILNTFQEDFEHARITFSGTDKYEKLRLSQKISPRTREWINQAIEFYKTLSEDEGLATSLHHLNPIKEHGDHPITRWRELFNKVSNLSSEMRAYDQYKDEKLFYQETEAWLRKFDAVAKMLFKKPEDRAKLFPDSEFFNK